MITRGDASPRLKRLRLRAGFTIWLFATVLCSGTFVSAAGLTSPEPLTKAYELILDARIDEAHRQLQHACPPAPRPACDVLDAVADYWQILLDQENTSRDGRLFGKIDASIASTESWVAREPKRAEAWFYNGGAYGTRVLLRGLREEYLAAARDGKRIHDSLRQAVAVDPTLSDAYFGLGLYHYYAAIAPTAARVVRFLLLLPAGDRAGGLKEMEQTRTQGMLLRGEADYQLHLIYLWYERQAMRSLGLIEGLRNRYPHNPVFYGRLANVQGDYLKNHQAALQTYRSLFDAAHAGRVAVPAISEVNARLGMAQELGALCDTDQAIDQLRAVIAQRPAAPYAAVARAYYQLGVVFDRVGRRPEAIDAYESARTANPPDDRLDLSAKLRVMLKRPVIGRGCK
jgi:tetratricopeptide (TPR) repeat protein